MNGLKYTLRMGTGKGFPDTCASLSTYWGSIICTCHWIMFKNDSMMQMYTRTKELELDIFTFNYRYYIIYQNIIDIRALECTMTSHHIIVLLRL